MSGISSSEEKNTGSLFWACAFDRAFKETKKTAMKKRKKESIVRIGIFYLSVALIIMFKMTVSKLVYCVKSWSWVSEMRVG